MDASEREHYARQLAKAGEAQINFVRTEIDVGVTLLQIAETALASGSVEHSQQALEKAQTAYRQAWTYLVLARKSHPESAAMLEEEIRGLEAKLAAIESRLRQV